MTASTCPDCGGASKPHEWDLTKLTDLVYRRYCTEARDCLECGNLWDEKRRREMVEFSLALRALLPNRADHDPGDEDRR